MLAFLLATLGGWQTTYQTQQQCNGSSCSMVQVPVQVWVPDPPVPARMSFTLPTPALPSKSLPETVNFRFY